MDRDRDRDRDRRCTATDDAMGAWQHHHGRAYYRPTLPESNSREIAIMCEKQTFWCVKIKNLLTLEKISWNQFISWFMIYVRLLESKNGMFKFDFQKTNMFESVRCLKKMIFKFVWKKKSECSMLWKYGNLISSFLSRNPWNQRFYE